MAVEWDDLIPSKVFTEVKTKFPQSIKTKYKMTDKNFSTVGSSDAPAVFPFVMVQLLPASEIGQDLEGISVNGGRFTFQIDVTDNQSQTRAKEVMREIKHIMKTMRFNISEMPTFDSTKNTHRATMRCTRLIGADDIL